jgi:hypothetical protein
MSKTNLQPPKHRRAVTTIDSPAPVAGCSSTPTVPIKADLLLNLGGLYGRVSKSFFDLIHARAELRISDLQQGELYNAEHLLGVSYWAAMSADECKRAGKCLSVLARDGHLPLIRHKVGSKTSQYYLVA